MSTLLLLHLTGLALWLGVIGVEFIIERGRARSREVGYAVARGIGGYWLAAGP